MNRTTLPIHEILVIDRQRINLGDIDELANSIHRYGLIQPIVINQEKRLIAGGRRLAACTKLGLSVVDVVFRETLTVDELHEMELEENVRRQEMSWQERALNVLKIHELKTARSAVEGQKWGMQETAEMLGLRARSRVHYNNEIARKLRAELLLPEPQRRFWQCESLIKAWDLRLRDEAEMLEADLAKDIAIKSQPMVEVKPLVDTLLEEFLPAVEYVATTKTNVQPPNTYLSGYAPEIPPIHLRTTCPLCNGSGKGCDHCKATGFAWTSESDRGAQITMVPVYEEYKAEQVNISSRLHNQSCIDWMLAHPESVDHIITDPPYGIEMSNLAQQNTGMSNIDTVETEHVVVENLDLFKAFFPAAFGAIKSSGYLVLWCDIMQWNTLYETAISAGFKVQRWPITWVKTYRCMNQSANQNFTKSTEIAMVCRKGTATLAEIAGECHILASHDEYKDTLSHPFVKPYDVWKYLIEHCTYPDQTILEPFAGRGSGVLSIIQLKRQFIACEINTPHYNALVENIKQHYLTINPSYSFV